MKITLAHSAGFCYGVRRAVKIAEDLANEGVSAVMLGPIIHNDAEIQRLGALGMETVDDPQDIPQGTAVVLRSHGEMRETFSFLKTKGLEAVDTTCPNVSRIHRCGSGTRLL